MSEGVQEAMLIHRVTPVYPLTAIKTRVSGVVRLAAVIGADGRIRELQVLGGHPFLVQAAVNAVREWVYRPTMLNGSPVEVMTDITVTFNLR
jgi:protein TonB